MTELLPCPFCGPGQSMVDPWFDDVGKRWAVGCGRCGSSSGRSVHAEGSKEAAIASWNRRGYWSPIETAPHAVRVLLGYWYRDEWISEVAEASHGWSRNGVSTLSRHGQAMFWMPLPAPPSNLQEKLAGSPPPSRVQAMGE